MHYKKSFFVCLVSFLLMTNVPIAMATPPADELNQYLSELGWTKQELINYLNYYEMPLEGFSTAADLKTALGAPINERNLQALMNQYNLSAQGLNKLLSQFGDSLKDYKFISDLEHSVTFYQYHQDYMAKIKSELAQMGVTEQEVIKFFGYLSMVEEENKDQLHKMQLLDYQIEQFFMTIEDPTQLNREQANQLAQILTQTFNFYDIQVKFKMNNKDIALNDLLTMNTASGSLYTAISSEKGEPLLDFTVPTKFFQAMTNAWEELIHLGKMSKELVDHLHNEKYNDLNISK